MMADRRVRTFGSLVCETLTSSVKLTLSSQVQRPRVRYAVSFWNLSSVPLAALTRKLLPNAKCWREITWPASTDRTMRSLWAEVGGALGSYWPKEEAAYSRRN